MKYTLSTVAALIAAASVSYGYTVSASNLGVGNPSETPVLDNAGNPIALGSGVIATGYFGSLSDGDLTSTIDGLGALGDFVQFGDATVGFANAFSAPGFFAHSTDAPIPNGGNAFTGNNIYVLIGDGATLAGSSFIGIWKSDVQFGEENQLGLGSADAPVQPGNGGLLTGQDGGEANVGVGPTFVASIQLASTPVPEPSSALLLGLGGLGLLIRRKR